MGLTGSTSQEASDMVLADDNFATIIGGRRWKVVFDIVRIGSIFLLPSDLGLGLRLC